MGFGMMKLPRFLLGPAMPPSIERRVYGPDSSPEEIAAIQARLSRYNADTFVWEEMPIQSPFSVEVMLREIQRQTANLPSFNLVVNLTQAEPPPQEVRTALYRSLDALTNMKRCACYTGRNFLLNAAAKFVLVAVRVKVTVHKTLEDALRDVGAT